MDEKVKEAIEALKNTVENKNNKILELEQKSSGVQETINSLKQSVVELKASNSVVVENKKPINIKSYVQGELEDLIKTNGKLEGKLELKQITTTGFIEDGNQTVIAPNRSDVPIIQKNNIFSYRDYFLSTVPSTSQSFSYNQKIERVDNTGIVSEGGLYGKSSFNFESKDFKAHKIGTEIEYSLESEQNLPYLTNLIVDELNQLLEKDVNNRVINGTGTNDIDGLLSQATTLTFTPDDFENSIETVSAYDHIVGIYKAIDRYLMLVNELPEVVILNITDYSNLFGNKTSNGDYVDIGSSGLISFVNGTPYINSVPVVRSERLAKDNYIISRISGGYARILQYGNTVVEFDRSIGFSRDMITAKIRTFIGLEIRAAFAQYKGTLSALKAAIVV